MGGRARSGGGTVCAKAKGRLPGHHLHLSAKFVGACHSVGVSTESWTHDGSGASHNLQAGCRGGSICRGGVTSHMHLRDGTATDEANLSVGGLSEMLDRHGPRRARAQVGEVSVLLRPAA
eukprot:scaffold112264_cov32-Tisochrysis_lutea.AAC.2